MTAPKKLGIRSRVCISQIACEGTYVNQSSKYVDCFKCREKKAQREKPPKQLRGQRCIDTYQGRL